MAQAKIDSICLCSWAYKPQHVSWKGDAYNAEKDPKQEQQSLRCEHPQFLNVVLWIDAKDTSARGAAWDAYLPPHPSSSPGLKIKKRGRHHRGRYNFCLAEVFSLLTLEPNFWWWAWKSICRIVGHRGSHVCYSALRVIGLCRSTCLAHYITLPTLKKATADMHDGSYCCYDCKLWWTFVQCPMT